MLQNKYLRHAWYAVEAHFVGPDFLSLCEGLALLNHLVDQIDVIPIQVAQVRQLLLWQHQVVVSCFRVLV